MKKVATAGNTVVPALVALEKLGFVVTVEQSGETKLFRATRVDENYLAEDPVAVLGLVKLIEMRGWDWKPGDAEIDKVMLRYELG